MDPIAGTCSQRPAGAAAQRGSAPLRARCRALPGSGPAVRKGRCASPLKRLPSTPLLTGLPPRFFRHWRRSAPPPACPPRLSCFPCVTAVMPAEARWPRGNEKRWVTRGAAAFGRPRGGPAGRPSAAKQKSGPGAKGPGAALSGRAAPSRRPPSAGVLPCQASGPLPMSGPPACSAGKPETFSSQFSPAFLKAGQGGGAPNGDRGSAPAAKPQRRGAAVRVALWERWRVTP